MLELRPGVSPLAAKLIHYRGQLVAGFRRSEVHLQLKVLNAPLPLVDLGLGELLVQFSLLGVELVDLGLQLSDVLVSRHESNVHFEPWPGQGRRSRVLAAGRPLDRLVLAGLMLQGAAAESLRLP